MEERAPSAVIAAILANLVIAGAKFTAAGISGSSAMFAEGIHSIVDTGNGLLMLLGIRKASQPADEAHPFGHGKELYFWTLIVAVLVFALGGGMSMYEGISRMLHPRPIQNLFWSYVTLGIALIAESTSLAFAWQRFRKFNPATGLLRGVSESKDPSTFAVLLEDSAAVLGLGIAFFGILLGTTLDNPYFDGGASILIGLILAGVALLLAREAKGLLIGESARPATIREIRSIIRSFPAVIETREVLTMYLGASNFLVMLDLRFDPDISSREVAMISKDMAAAIRRRFPRAGKISINSAA